MLRDMARSVRGCWNRRLEVHYPKKQSAKRSHRFDWMILGFRLPAIG